MGVTAWLAGFAMIGAAALMILVARPKDGESAPFLKVWIVGQIYAMVALIGVVLGVTLVVIDWPF